MSNIRKIYLIFILLILYLLSGCDEKKDSDPNSQEKTEISTEKINTNSEYTIKNAIPIDFKVGEQEFEIVPVLNPILEYIQQVKENPDYDYKELYVSTVVEPFRKEAFGKNGGLRLKDEPNFAAPINIEKLNESIQILDEEYNHISLILKEVLESSSNLLPSDKTTIYLFPYNPDRYIEINRMSGVTGFGTSNQVIILHLAPQKYNKEMLKYTVAHEYHHVAYYEKNKNKSKNRDLVEYVLAEGMADSFAKIMIPSVEPPWIKELSSNEEQSIWNWILERRYSYTETDLVEMRRGNRTIPPWSEYKIGYQIMQDFLIENPDVSIEEWTTMDADEILEKSNFTTK